MIAELFLCVSICFRCYASAYDTPAFATASVIAGFLAFVINLKECAEEDKVAKAERVKDVEQPLPKCACMVDDTSDEESNTRNDDDGNKDVNDEDVNDEDVNDEDVNDEDENDEDEDEDDEDEDEDEDDEDEDEDDDVDAEREYEMVLTELSTLRCKLRRKFRRVSKLFSQLDEELQSSDDEE